MGSADGSQTAENSNSATEMVRAASRKDSPARPSLSVGRSYSPRVVGSLALAPGQHFDHLNRQLHDQCDQQERGDYESEENLHQDPHVNLLRNVAHPIGWRRTFDRAPATVILSEARLAPYPQPVWRTISVSLSQRFTMP
jgi:hypothetical protein